MRRSPLLLPLLLLTFLAVAISNAGGQSPPGPRWIDAVGRFAVVMHSLSAQVPLKYVNVVSSQVQPAGRGGFDYKLVVTAASTGGSTAQYNVQVWGMMRTQSWNLVSFTPN